MSNHLKSKVMKKIFLGIAFLLASLPTSATKYKVVCCDGTTKYFIGVDVFSTLMHFGSDEERNEVLRNMAAPYCIGGCVRSVSVDHTITYSQNLPPIENITKEHEKKLVAQETSLLQTGVRDEECDEKLI